MEAHHLFPEPSYIKGEPVTAAQTAPNLPNIPPEALRFFYIDHAWLDAFIDGALSCANHIDPQHDVTRLYIKDVYNFYLRSDIHPLEGKTPPIPRYGFVLRSSVVKALPDLKTTVNCRKFDEVKSVWVEDERDPVVRLTRMDASTILCLLDCLPEEILAITIAQPPHQQRFKMGSGIAVEELPDGTLNGTTDFVVRRLYTKNAPSDGRWPMLDQSVSQSLDQSGFYNANTRCIDPEAIATNITDFFNTKYPNDYADDFSNSAMLGLLLNDPSCRYNQLNSPKSTF